ncbi:MAG: C25 family cysteine peptidase [Candidatus Thermoplasmatota archaeon]|nr:C25 family cysteine peptidase [Candidatus Thermoplasmatota archaeon]
MKRTTTHNFKVGRLVVGVAICVLMLTTSVTTALVDPKDLNNQGLISSSQLTYTWSFREPEYQTIATDGSEYTLVNMQGLIGRGTEVGAPQLPMKMIQLLLPPKTAVINIHVTGTPVLVSPPVDLLTHPVLPYQKSVPFGSTEPQVFEKNLEIYSASTPYPSEIRTQHHVGYSHGYAILDFGLSPLQYTPGTGALMFYPTMTVTITLEKTGYVSEFFRDSPADASYVQSFVANPEILPLYETADMPILEYPGGLCDPSGNYDYVIITTTQSGLDYWDVTTETPYNWESLMDQHAGDGLSSTLVTVQDIDACPDYFGTTPFNDQQAHVREFCKDAYEDWGTQYILVAGDSNYIPARLMSSGGESNVDSDLYWSNLDNNFNGDSDGSWGEEGDSGFDFYAELFVGRVTCDVPQDVSNWLTKSFFYANSADWEYLDNAAFYGGNTGWSCQGDDFMDYSAIKGTNEWLGPDPDQFPSWVGFQYGFETWNLVNPGNMYNLSVKYTEAPSPNPGWNGAGVSGFRDAINNDLVTIISGIAHADNQMSLDVYADDWESDYHNTRPFFIHDYGCHCGDFNDGDDGVLETMLFHSDVELAFGCVYNTGYGWGNLYCTNSSSAFQTKEFWRFFLDVENLSLDLGNWQIGRSHAHSKDMMAPMIDWDGGTWREIVQCCLLFGDPAQMLRTPHPSLPPTTPSKPVGPTLGIWNVEYSYTSQATEPDNEEIFYLFDWGDGSNSGWLGPYSSGATATGKHTWTVLGSYTVKVKARDVWGAGSGWSEELPVTITDNTPPTVPEVTGPAEGKPGNPYLFNMVSTDAQDQTIYYFVDWGDGTTTDWLGPYLSGTQIHQTHSWADEGSYTVKVKAKDSMNSESDWGELTVAMPTEYKFTLLGFIQQLLGMFPNLFPILRHLVGY